MIHVSRFTAWAPGLDTPQDWHEWAREKREISETGEGPELAFTESLFRRRLSQISRMTIQVVHDLLPLKGDTKIVFLSFRGEITQQLRINKMLVDQGSIMPAIFSRSVFNTPIAMATIALNLTAGYSAVYPGDNRFDTAFLAAAAPVLCGGAAETVLAYADELAPREYGELCPPENRPLAFAAILSRREEGIPLTLPGEPAGDNSRWESPATFLRYLYRYQDADDHR
jgi:hypothetical protein